jgi:hypothetical protein
MTRYMPILASCWLIGSKGDYSRDTRKRELQLEAKAHIAVQSWIDKGSLRGRVSTAADVCEIHRRFCELLPEDMPWVPNATDKERIPVIPGQLRRAALSGTLRRGL